MATTIEHDMRTYQQSPAAMREKTLAQIQSVKQEACARFAEEPDFQARMQQLFTSYACIIGEAVKHINPVRTLRAIDQIVNRFHEVSKNPATLYCNDWAINFKADSSRLVEAYRTTLLQPKCGTMVFSLANFSLSTGWPEKADVEVREIGVSIPHVNPTPGLDAESIKTKLAELNQVHAAFMRAKSQRVQPTLNEYAMPSLNLK